MHQHWQIRCDDEWDEIEGAPLEFRLTYAGELKAHSDAKRLRGRTNHVHQLRQCFHTQLKRLWQVHPLLVEIQKTGAHYTEIPSMGFNWRPLATKDNGLICKLDIQMMRSGAPGRVLADIDNRLKTLFDALRSPETPEEIGGGPNGVGQFKPEEGQNPFFVLMTDDRLITHISVSTDELLEAVPGVPDDNAVRLTIGVTIKPYDVTVDNMSYV